MTIANTNHNLNTYLYTFLKEDLQRVQSNAMAEFSSQEIAISNPVKGISEIKDEYVPSVKPRVEVTLEERMNQILSPEEIKNLLSLLMRTPRITSSIPGQLVDVKG